ncbi:probable transcriptional regulatory protein HRM2_04000 [Pecten maximus]|uniref:probable transcriptional regulatory protein HRM2_04000 n=1 Tax=Pecten maximus TaxID=6579 RepID=UPI001458FF17|nr:probable transcriptional regulatory protein HRM2_04000 [Pecten maximus]XP_033761710.1 probable transcriptional regulatory protein HRM2_04000 [Pecten maximus]
MYGVMNRYSYLCRRHIYTFIQKNGLSSCYHQNVSRLLGSCVLDKGNTCSGTNMGLYRWPWPCHQCSVARIHTTANCTAGHNRWSNIKHIKGRSDHKRALLYSNHIKIITGVCNNTKEKNPKYNPELARCLTAAKAAGVPTDLLNRLMDKLKRTDLKPYLLEVEGPDGIGILLHCMVIGEHETSEIHAPLKKKGYNIGRKVNVAYKFDHKGVITVPPRNQEEINLDEYLEVGLEAGAEDVTLETDGDGNHFIQFICQPSEMNIVVGKMEKMGLNGILSQEVYSPIYPVMVTQEKGEAIHSLFNQIISKHDFIEDVTYNFEILGESE